MDLQRVSAASATTLISRDVEAVKEAQVIYKIFAKEVEKRETEGEYEIFRAEREDRLTNVERHQTSLDNAIKGQIEWVRSHLLDFSLGVFRRMAVQGIYVMAILFNDLKCLTKYPDNSDGQCTCLLDRANITTSLISELVFRVNQIPNFIIEPTMRDGIYLYTFDEAK